MPTENISFKKTGYFSSLICDYIQESDTLHPFYNQYPKIDNFKSQITEKQKSFNLKARNILFDSLMRQYRNTEISKNSLRHIQSLKQVCF